MTNPSERPLPRPSAGANPAPTPKANSSARVAIEVSGVRKVFHQEEQTLEVLRGIDLEVREGEMICIRGRSGAGKSTLLHILGTLDLPTEGAVRYYGEDVTQYNSAKLAAFRNDAIGFVFQFHHLLPEFDALENVMMPGLVRGRRESELAPRATQLLEHVGLGERLHHRPGELSGGEQQRVALARALVMKPKVILADEPTGNLDSVTSDAMFKLFFELNRDLGTTFCIVTHSNELAMRMPRRIEMRDGVIASDTANETPYRTSSHDDLPSDGPAEAGESAES